MDPVPLPAEVLRHVVELLVGVGVDETTWRVLRPRVVHRLQVEAAAGEPRSVETWAALEQCVYEARFEKLVAELEPNDG